MTVKIDVDLKKIDSTDLEKIKAQLKSLDEDLDLDLDLDSILEGEFEDIKIDIDKNHLKNQLKKVASDLKADSVLNPAEDPRSGDSGDRDRATIKDLQNELQKINGQLGSINKKTDASSTSKSSSDSDSRKTPPLGVDVSFPKRFSGNNFKQARVGQFSFRSGPKVNRVEGSVLRDSLKLNQVLSSDKGISIGDSREIDVDRDRSALRSLKGSFSAVSLAASNMTNSLSNLRPTFGRVRAVIYTLLPALIGLGGQLLAVAAGMTALTAAAGLVTALGLLGGESETLEGSMASAEEKVNDLKQELFEVVEPIADLFAPVTDDLFDEVVNNVRGLTDEFAALRPLTSVIFDALNGTGVIVEELLQSVIRLGPRLESMAGTFGNIIVSGLPEFFNNIFKEGLRTSDVLIKVGVLAFELGRIIYFVSKSIASLISIFAVLTPVLSFVADILGSRIGQSLLIIIGYLTSLIVIGLAFSKLVGFLATMIMILNTAMTTQLGILGVLKSTWTGRWIMDAIGGITKLIGWVAGLNSVLAQAAALMSIVTLGAAAIAGLGALTAGAATVVGNNLSGNNPAAQGGGGNTYNDVTMNFQGDMDNASQKKMEDVARGVMYQDDLSGGAFGTNK